ncbi:hypothetical protein MBAV_003038 [Candidatus Magnetobacterium bavaricum]|uniref:NYN domain-containing protein n=1 Tax=Candidatus Magnetobacterium bavaricum TaxID=29290 RepID=A0A0F3GSI3_9BACT|nr:hypothetical protein MBAV_003038 [Candidatus Magnetobacterium bavaricum]
MMANSKNRAIFFIDGLNVYHSIASDAAYCKYKWLDLTRLVRCFVNRDDRIARYILFYVFSLLE